MTDILNVKTLTDYELAKQQAAGAFRLIINPQIYRYNMASLKRPVSHIKLFQKVWI
jgi:hypothetical protein